MTHVGCRINEKRYIKKIEGLEKQVKTAFAEGELHGMELQVENTNKILAEEIKALTEQRDEAYDALRLCINWMPKAEVRSWPSGFKLRDEALTKARAALPKEDDND
jgi:hypothetical protein